MAKRKKNGIKSRKVILKEDNLKEDRVIKSLEKKLRINKKSSKYIPKSFAADGLDCKCFFKKSLKLDYL